MEVIHVPVFKKTEIPPLQKLKQLKGRIGLVTSIQYVKLLPEIKKELGDKVVYDKALAYPGQVLGCHSGAALKIEKNVNHIVFVGEGRFHAINVALTTKKPTYILYLNGELEKITKKQIIEYEKKYWTRLSKAAEARKYGIIITTKPGQNFGDAEKIQQLIPNSYVFVGDTITPHELRNYSDIDCWINTACPRISIDDYENYDKPIINSSEIPNLLKIKK